MKKINLKRVEVFLEFVVFGILIGIAEDVIAIKLTTGEAITPQVILIVVSIAIPFAFLGEIIADQVDFIKLFRRFFKR